MSTTTSPGPAVGSGTSARCSTSGPPCFSNSTAFIALFPLLLLLQNLHQQLAPPFRLLLLHPMPDPVDEVAADHTRACVLLHPLEIAGALVGSPVAFSGDEDRRHIDGTAGKQLELGIIPAFRPA